MKKNDLQKVGLVIFSKTPGRNPAKTRIANQSDALLAEQVHLALFHNTLKLARSLSDLFTLYGCPAENDLAVTASDDWLGFECILTESVTLKDRVLEVINQLIPIHGSVIIIGTDCPDLDKMDLINALNFVMRGSSVIGPSYDGGFYLLALSDLVSKQRWDQIEWSSSKTCQGVTRCLGHLSPMNLDTKQDIDTLDDLKMYLARLSRKPHIDLESHLKKALEGFNVRSQNLETNHNRYICSP